MATRRAALSASGDDRLGGGQGDVVSPGSPGAGSVFRADAEGRRHLSLDPFAAGSAGAWFRSHHYQLYHASRGIHDTCLVCSPVNEDVESWFAFQRTDLRGKFTAGDERLVREALRPVKWFHRQLALAHGLALASAPLTTTQRSVLRLLLSEKSEKEIAHELGQSFHTTHEHVINIFAKFGVQSCPGLMALWLGWKN